MAGEGRHGADETLAVALAGRATLADAAKQAGAAAKREGLAMNSNRLSKQPATESDAGELAREMATAFGRMASHYREYEGAAPDEARTLAAQGSDAYFEQILGGPPDQVSWGALDLVGQQDPAKALARWDEIKEAARREIRSGHRGARAIEGFGGECWDRARYLAVRSELREGWRPRTGIEELLVDQLAQWQTQLWHWQEITAIYTSFVHERCMRRVKVKKRPREEGEPERTRITESESLEQALAMVDRFHRLYARTLKALQDQRRLPAPVMRRNGQITVAGRQVDLIG